MIRRKSISYYFLCLRWLAIYIYVCVYSRWFIHQKDGTCRESVSFVMARQIQDIFLFFERNTMKNVGGGWWFRWRHEISHGTGLTNPQLMAGSLFVAGMFCQRLAMILNFPFVHLYSNLGNLFCLEVKGRHFFLFKHIMTFPCSCLTFHIPSFCWKAIVMRKVHPSRVSESLMIVMIPSLLWPAMKYSS